MLFGKFENLSLLAGWSLYWISEEWFRKLPERSLEEASWSTVWSKGRLFGGKLKTTQQQVNVHDKGL